MTIRAAACVALGAVAECAPGLASACGVCMSGLKESGTRYGFYAMTALLTLAGCGLMAGLALMVMRRYRAPSAAEARAGQQDERTPAFERG